MPISIQILIFIVGLLASSVVFALTMSHVQDNLLREIFSWLGLVIIICGMVGGLFSFIPAP
jgi:hypothetical protein